MPKTEGPIQLIVQTIVDTIQPERVLLFGSQAKGTAHAGSDYDFLVVIKGIDNEREASRLIYRALLERKPGVAVDIIVVDSEKLRRRRHNPYMIYRQALREGKVCYERPTT